MPFFFYSNQDIPNEFCNIVMKTISDFVGLEYIQSVIINKFDANDVSIDKNGRFVSKVSSDTNEKIKTIINLLIISLEKDFGRSFVEDKLRFAFLNFSKKHNKDDDFLKIINLIPTGYLENEKLRYLSKDQLESEVREKIRELQDVNEKLEEKVRVRTESLEKANEELKKLDKAKSHFISIVAHQLRTPLAGIKWSLDYLVEGGAGPLTDQQKLLATEILENGAQMISLIDDFLNVDNIQSGTITYEFKSTYIVDVISEILKKLSPIAAEKNITLAFEKNDNLPLVSVDPLKIKVVLQNLIENAIKYSRKNPSGAGRVAVGVEAVGNFIRITIADSGIGIPKDQQEYIFQRFFRARNAHEYEPNGSGLGLFITREIITAHKGKITFESQENVGTTFTIDLPLLSKI